MDTEAARAIIDANSYMTLATADADGAPWASPVWFAHDQYATFLWMSHPDARHSRNVAARREIAIVIFDSTVSPRQRNAVYVEATATLVPDAELADAVAVYAARSRRARAGDAGTRRSQRRRALASVSRPRVRGVRTRGRARSPRRRATRALTTRRGCLGRARRGQAPRFSTRTKAFSMARAGSSHVRLKLAGQAVAGAIPATAPHKLLPCSARKNGRVSRRVRTVSRGRERPGQCGGGNREAFKPRRRYRVGSGSPDGGCRRPVLSPASIDERRRGGRGFDTIANATEPAIWGTSYT